MKQASTTKTVAKNYNRPAYAVFFAASICFLVVKNYSQAFTFWGLALLFDPFTPEMPFSKRPLYQRAWLFIHAGLALLALGLLCLEK